MQTQTVHNFLFQMYDYADYLASQITPENGDSGLYFVSLLYIEDMMDTYGRGLISQSAKQEGEEAAHLALNEAHRRIDLLRERINALYKEYNFDQTLQERTRKLLRDWSHNPQ